MAKRWHPDIAPPGRRHEHQRPPSGDQPGRRRARAIRRDLPRRQGQPQCGQGIGGGRPRGPARMPAAGPTRTSSVERDGGEPTAPSTTRSARGCPTTRWCTAMPAASPIPSGAWGRSAASTSRATRSDSQQWARVMFAVGVRTIPAGSLQFVDFSKPDPAADRVQRFMTAAQHALAEGDAALAAQRLVYARDAEPANPVVLRLLTAAFWQAGNLPAAARTVRDWARVDTDRPTPERFASRIYEDMGAVDLAAEAAVRAAESCPGRRIRLGTAGPPAAAAQRPRRRDQRPGAGAAGRPVGRRTARSGARPSPGRRCRRRGVRRPRRHSDRARLAPGVVGLRPRAGPHRPAAECGDACRQALSLGDDAEVSQLLARVKAATPRGLSERSAA